MGEVVKKLIYLADDDADDRMLFEAALREVRHATNLLTAENGQQLMQFLNDRVPPSPDVIFLDLNMPRKNGFECLEEIKKNEKLRDIPVVIFSTSMQDSAINTVYKAGANFYICKPGTFTQLKKIIDQVLSIDWTENCTQPDMEKFILQP